MFARGYIVYSVIGVVGSVVMAAQNGEQGFAALNTVAILLLAASFAVTYVAPLHIAGSIVMLVNVALPVVLTFTYSLDASFDLNLFGVGLAMFVLMFDASAVLKVAFTFFIASTFVLLQFLPEKHGEDLGMLPERLARVSLVNNLLAVLTVLISVLVLQMRFAATRRILQGTALYGELQASTDELTGLVNRRPVHGLLDELDRRRSSEYAIVVVDIDEFKAVNDTFGHDCGDIAIAKVAEALTDSCREADVVSRWGGDEFVIILQRVLPSELETMLERVRREIESIPFECRGVRRSVTVSMGAAHGRPDRSAYDCFAAADQGVYRAKQDGRNRVAIIRDYASVTHGAGSEPSDS